MRITRRAALAGLAALATTISRPARADTTIELWSFIDPAGDSVRSKAVKKVIDTFEQQNPGVTVKTSIVAWDQLGAAMLRAAAAGRTPDVAMLHSGFIQRQIAAGALRPLDPYLAQLSAADRKDIVILPTALDKQHKDYGVPYELRVSGFIYRNDLLQKAGLPIPATLPALVDAGKKFQASQGEGFIGMSIAFNPARSDRGARWFVPTLVGMGGRVLKPDGSAEFNTQEGVRLVNWLKQTVDEKVMPLDIALSDPERDQQLCEAGRVGFDLEATHWLAAMRQKQGTPLSWMPSPGMDPGKPTPADVQGWNLVIPAAAKNPDAAWKLIEVWISPDIQMFQSTTAGYLPMRVSLQDNPAFQTPALDFIPRALAHASHDPLAFEWPENSDALNNALCRAVVSALSGKQDAPAALADAEQTYNTMVRK